MRGARVSCEKCGKEGFFKFELCKQCRQIKCVKCNKQVTFTYPGQLRCNTCERIKSEKEKRAISY